MCVNVPPNITVVKYLHSSFVSFGCENITIKVSCGYIVHCYSPADALTLKQQQKYMLSFRYPSFWRDGKKHTYCGKVSMSRNSGDTSQPIKLFRNTVLLYSLEDQFVPQWDWRRSTQFTSSPVMRATVLRLVDDWRRIELGWQTTLQSVLSDG